MRNFFCTSSVDAAIPVHSILIPLAPHPPPGDQAAEMGKAFAGGHAKITSRNPAPEQCWEAVNGAHRFSAQTVQRRQAGFMSLDQLPQTHLRAAKRFIMGG